jgi:hypothetical protein
MFISQQHIKLKLVNLLIISYFKNIKNYFQYLLYFFHPPCGPRKEGEKRFLIYQPLPREKCLVFAVAGDVHYQQLAQGQVSFAR